MKRSLVLVVGASVGAMFTIEALAVTLPGKVILSDSASGDPYVNLVFPQESARAELFDRLNVPAIFNRNCITPSESGEICSEPSLDKTLIADEMDIRCRRTVNTRKTLCELVRHDYPDDFEFNKNYSFSPQAAEKLAQGLSNFGGALQIADGAFKLECRSASRCFVVYSAVTDINLPSAGSFYFRSPTESGRSAQFAVGVTTVASKQEPAPLRELIEGTYVDEAAGFDISASFVQIPFEGGSINRFPFVYRKTFTGERGRELARFLGAGFAYRYSEKRFQSETSEFQESLKISCDAASCTFEIRPNEVLRQAVGLSNDSASSN